MAPKILVVHTLEWANAARIALAFAAAGCLVSAVCRRGHQLRVIRSLDRVYPYKPFARVRSIEAAIIDCSPDLIVPCDDRAVLLLHRLYRRADPRSDKGARIRLAIERSLGRPDAYDLITTRSELPALAALADIRIPPTERVLNLESLTRWCAGKEFPVVLKADHSWGGWGVQIVQTGCDLRSALRRMTGGSRFVLGMKRLVWDQDPELMLQLMRGNPPALMVQHFVRGPAANCSVACWQGEILAAIAVEALVTHGPTGNATVVRIVDDCEMIEIASRIIRHASASGIFGFDFILEESSGHAVLLEVNPRVTQISHLALGRQQDLVAAIAAELSGKPLGETPVIPKHRVIAFFPQELRRDPASPFLHLAYHDVPLEEPALVDAFMVRDGLARRTVARVRAVRESLRSGTKHVSFTVPRPPPAHR